MGTPRRFQKPWLQFTLQHGVGFLGIRNLSITTWDGDFSEELPGEVRTGEHTLRLRNGDVFTGTLLQVKENRFMVRHETLGTIPIAQAGIHTLHFTSPETQKPRATQRDVRVFCISGGDRITFSLLHLDEETLVGSSDVWVEPLHIPRTMVDQLQFNVHMRNRPLPSPRLGLHF